MAGNAKGWTLHRDRRNGNYIVRFRCDGKRRNLSTCERVLKKAKIRAAELYAQALFGEGGERRVSNDLAFDVMYAQWLDATSWERDETTNEQYLIHGRAHFIGFFRSMDRLTTRVAEDYKRMRLAVVTASTLRKELSALRGFVRWCSDQAIWRDPPVIRPLPRNAQGVAHEGGKRAKVRVDLNPEQVRAILQALPDTTAHGLRPRAYYTVMSETALRKGTMDALEAPTDYRAGNRRLRIRASADKARFGREIPLTDKAREVLDAVCPKSGLIFGAHTYRRHLHRAALAAGLPPHKARHLSNHDFRHAAITNWASQSNNLAGVGFLAGHKHATTTSKYIHGTFEQGQEVLASLGG